jgi:hypothetical protein
MFPFLKEGDVLSFSQDTPLVGDIVIFYDQQELVAHRFLGEFTKGDRNLFLDDIKPHSYVGTVISIQRGDREIYLFSGMLMKLMALCSIYSLKYYGLSIRYLHQVILYLAAYFSWFYFSILTATIKNRTLEQARVNL